MANSKRKFVALCLCASVVTGCASVKVVPNPGARDRGIRYYRPKPYLLVTPADPTGRMVNMKLEYLPDYNEEYSVHLKHPKASVALKDGWNLVGVNTKEAPKDKEEPPAKIEDIKLPPAVVAATNVPIGYYESVYGMDAANGGKKFLQGWRYIGMTSMGGGKPGVCRVSSHKEGCPNDNKDAGCINGPLYGLVFFNGVMTFRQLDEIANNQLCPMFVNPAPVPPAPVAPVIPATPVNPPILETVPGTRPKPEVEREVIPVPTPPIPAPTVPPAGPTSQVKPKAGPALATAAPGRPSVAPGRPSVASTRPSVAPAASRPTATPILAAKPAALPPLGAKVATAPAPTFRKVAVTAPAASAKAPKVAASPDLSPPATLDRDPLMGTSPSLDKDLFRTGTSPRP